jgi:putative colanic acid biosynthesis acetyltransferase WcaF
MTHGRGTKEPTRSILYSSRGVHCNGSVPSNEHCSAAFGVLTRLATPMEDDSPVPIGATPISSPTEAWKADLQDGPRWPYPFHVYLLRLLWLIVSKSIWPLLPARFHPRRTLLLRLFGAESDLHVLIARSVTVELPWALSVGRYSTIGPRVRLYNLGGLEIGHHSMLSQDVYVCGGTHDYHDPTMPLLRKKIVIGHHVWIAAGAFIGPGVTIGEGAVVGARSVVTRDVAPWTVVAGNPARFVKLRQMHQVNEPAEVNS